MKNYCRKKLHRNALNSNLYMEMYQLPSPKIENFVYPTSRKNFQQTLASSPSLREADTMIKTRGCMFLYWLSNSTIAASLRTLINFLYQK